MSPLLYMRSLTETSKLQIALAAALALLLAGCSTAQEVRYVPTARPFCAAVTTVCVNDADQLTDPTAKQVLGNNRGLDELSKKKLCPPQPKCKAS